MKKILITGGAGFVGSNLISKLFMDGFSILNIDNFSNGLRQNLVEGVPTFEANLSESAWMADLSGEKFDVVIHCAAQSSNALSLKSPVQDLADNQLATLNIIKYCNYQNINRLIFTSSMSAYGSPSIFPTPTSTPLNPLTYYGIHKSSSEQYIKINNHLDWTIFRLYTTYGFGQNLNNSLQGLISIYLEKILRNEVLEVHGSLRRERDIIHVDDVVNAIHTAISKPATFKKTYNLATGKFITIQSIITHLLNGLGKNNDYPVIEKSGDVGDPFTTHADISSTINDLGWKPVISHEEGLRMTTEKYLNISKHI